MSGLLFYLCSMLVEDDLQQRWLQLQQKLMERLGKTPNLEAVLFYIGVQEAGLPPKTFTEQEKADLLQVAVCTILVPAKYYELMWVDDTGWPHFKQLERVPEMKSEERERFLLPFVLKYAEKNKLI
jgi:hypothetical protein